MTLWVIAQIVGGIGLLVLLCYWLLKYIYFGCQRVYHGHVARKAAKDIDAALIRFLEGKQ